MSADLKNVALLACLFLALFGIAELLYHVLKLRAEITRKIVHIGTGLLTLLFPVLLTSHWYVLVLCSSFAAILLASQRFRLLQSINAIDRQSHGSISYPVSVYCCYLVYYYFRQESADSADALFWFYLPITTLAICDPVAALAGKTFPYGRYTIGRDTKTIVGSSAFFLSSFVLTYVVGSLLQHDHARLAQLMPLALAVAATAAIAEALSGRGIDNITIPAATIVVMLLMK